MVHKFFKVQQIKYKKANLICGLHMAIKPLITHDFLIQLKNEASNFTALQIWNCDKTSFPTDVGQCKVKAPKWKQPNKLTSVMGRANISVYQTKFLSCALFIYNQIHNHLKSVFFCVPSSKSCL